MNRCYLFIYNLLLPFLKLFYPRRQKERPPLPEGAAIICANHSNLVDPLLMAITFGKKHHLRFMAKIELSRIPLIGWLIAWLLGIIGGLVDIYVVVGIVVLVLVYLKVIKD